MEFDFSEQQQIISNMAKKFVANECPMSYVREMEADERGYTPGLWAKMSDLGFMGLMIPEELGGSGGSFLDLAVLLYETGYGALPGPLFSAAVLGGITLLEAGTNAQKEAILPEIASGERIATLAWIEKGGRYTASDIALQAGREGEEYVLSGTKLFVPDAGAANLIICAGLTGAGDGTREESVSLFLVDANVAGLKKTPLRTMAGDKQFEVVFDGVRVPKSALLGEENRGWPVLERVLLKAAVAKCAEMSGGAQKVLEMVVQYTKERKQFGHLIGSFQAVQHHCANILTYADTARLLTYRTAWKVSAGLPFEKDASMCKAWVSEAFRRATALGHQVVGGMGFMEEHDLPIYFKRAKAAEISLGDAEFHRELVARRL